MLKPGDRVVAGISGGADSVCLLFLLRAYAGRVPITLTVVHVNHGIRKEAARDAAFVEELCRQWEIPFYRRSYDVKAIAREKKCSEEEAGRKVRYEAFAEVAKEIGAGKIAVAHNANDCSETMLFHLFRGTGIKGLSGIAPVRDNIIRPILCLERTEIEAYLEEQELTFCQDATNETDDYTRNRIRHHILPYAKEEISSGCINNMTRAAGILAQVEDYLEQQTKSAMELCVKSPEKNRYCIALEPFFGLHSVIRERILLQVIKELTPARKDISAVHVKLLLDVCNGETGRSVSLPFGIVGIREYENVIVKKERVDSSPVQTTVSLSIQELGQEPVEVVTDTGEKLIFTVFDYEKNQEVPQNEYTKWFDCDKIVKSLEIRTRRQGDFLSIRSGVGDICHKTLKDYMITEKIPRESRDTTLLLAEGSHVLWLPGYRISEFYKVTENTKRILQVEERHGGAY